MFFSSFSISRLFSLFFQCLSSIILLLCFNVNILKILHPCIAYPTRPYFIRLRYYLHINSRSEYTGMLPQEIHRFYILAIAEEICMNQTMCLSFLFEHFRLIYLIERSLCHPILEYYTATTRSPR